MSDCSLVIRAATPADDVACGVIVGDAASGSVLAPRLPHAREVMEDRSPFSAGDGERFVAETGSQIAGFVDVDAGACYVRHLFISPAWQGRGIGGALLEAAERRLGGRSWLKSLSVNDVALRWYMRRGYMIVGGELEEDWYGGPAVWIHLQKPPHDSVVERARIAHQRKSIDD